jgi:hypothetical protein
VVEGGPIGHDPVPCAKHQALKPLVDHIDDLASFEG